MAVQSVVQLVRFQLVNLSGELNSTTFGEFQKTNAASNSDQSFKFKFEFSSEFLMQRTKKKQFSSPTFVSAFQVQVSAGSPLASSDESRNVSQKRVQRILSG